MTRTLDPESFHLLDDVDQAAVRVWVEDCGVDPDACSQIVVHDVEHASFQILYRTQQGGGFFADVLKTTPGFPPRHDCWPAT